MNPQIIIIITAVLGFLLAGNIFYKKHKKQPLVCPLKSDCNTVINSQFSNLFGIPLEILGLVYYAIIASSYTAFLFNPLLKTDNTTLILLVLTTLAFLFSIYLTLVQALAIKQWCVWCLISASFCLIIFSGVSLSTSLTLFDILHLYYEWILVALTCSLVLGVGASTIYNLLYVKFLKDLQISKIEQETLQTVSQVIWISIIVLSVSGLSLYLSQPEIYNLSSTFLVKIFVMIFIIVGEIFLNIILAPQLINLSTINPESEADLHYLRRISIAVSLTTLVSWYTLLSYIVLPINIDINFTKLVSYYLGALLIAVAVSQFIDYRLTRIK